MKIETRTKAGTTIADITGSIDLASSPALRRTLLDSLKQTDRLAANLAGVKYIDSSGIASLLEVLKEARGTGKRFVIFGPSVGVREVLHLTRLTGVFETYDGEDEALAMARPGGGSHP
jgi:anti-sigma B factor antagonist